jgi:hypothetical protein
MASMNPCRRLRQGERGAELIEFALVLPLLLLLVLGIVDFGFLFQRLEVVTNAAREGARIAVLPGYGTADIRDRVNDYLEEGGVPIVRGTNPVININPISIAPGGGGATIPSEQVQVLYSHSYLFLSGLSHLFGGNFNSVPLTGQSTMRCEPGGCP